MYRSIARILSILVLTASTLQAQVVISEFRVRGPNGGSDEFIELLNVSAAPVDIGGWRVNGSNSSAGTGTRATITAGTTLQPGCHYLLTNSSTSGGPYSGSVAGNQTYTTGITDDGGIALLNGSTIVDQVGLSAGSAYKEGAPLPTLGSTNADHGYARKNGGTQDTGDNLSDFALVSPSGPESGCGIPVSTPPSGSGSASPSSVSAGDAVTLLVTVSPGTNPPSSGIGVTGDLSSIGGPSSQSFADQGGNVFRADSTIAPGTTSGAKSIPVTITDAEGRSGNASIDLTVNGTPTVAPGSVVISQLYGGGGNSGATLKNDFIELFNRTDSPISLDGWSVQYVSSSGSFSGNLTPLAGTIQPHRYYLIQEAAGAAGTADLPPPDFTGSIAMGAGAGKVALVSSTGALSGTCPTGGDLVDFVGYGGANCSETHSIGSLSNTTAAFRDAGGCLDTDNNSLDFFVATPAPRNSSTAENGCGSAPPPPAPHVVISQIYGGGGNSGAQYQNDFVELYNPTGNPVDISDWSIQYASATGNAWGTGSQPLGGTIEPGGYFLVQLGSGGADGPPLPSPRIIGTINMSAASGKVALVTHVEGLTGNCPIGDPTLVDFVGYGSADCYEGGLNAPGLSNTSALFRTADTDHNSEDFVLDVPNPRGGGPLVDLVPRITGVDPSGADAPRDASITLSFSEPVTAVGAWYSIGCTVTGPHVDNEVASAFGSDTWIITPNQTFQPGETCTIHVFRNTITDLDGQPDNLPADVEWTFTVATGAPVETADVHLLMGNPSGATLNDPDNYLMEKPEYAESYNRDRGTPNWVSWHLSDDWTAGGSGGRTDTFRPDPALPRDWYRVLQTDFSGSGFDRGHMCPSADRTTTIPINQATFLMSNMVPQSPDNNQGPWEQFESDLRALLPGNEIYIVSGPAGRGGSGSNGFATAVAQGHVTVPASTWKVALILPKDDGNDVSRVTAAARTIAISIPNTQGIKSDPWTQYLTTVRDIETLTGYDFFSSVPQIVQNSIENGRDGINPPGVADESATVEAGTPADLTLEAVSPISAPSYSYTIVQQTAHGTLAGSGAVETYTPAVFFTGTDTFTFRVNDGFADSNTATFTLHVTDTVAPSISALTPSVTQLWPVDHRMVDVTVAYSVSDLGDAAPGCSLHVASSDAANGTGDGNTPTDWEIVDAHHIRLRAERAGTGDGRTYTVGADCVDASGNLAHGGTATVVVPKSQK